MSDFWLKVIRAEGLVMYILLLVLVHQSCANWFYDGLARVGEAAVGLDTSDTCGFTRDDALQCIKTYVDENHDGKISCEEFERAKDLFMPPRMKAALWLAKKLGYDVHFEQVLYGCDANHDCIFTEEDWMESKKRCLPFKSDLCKLKTACDIAAQNTVVYTHDDWKRAELACAYFTIPKCHELEQKWMKEDALAEYKKKMLRRKAFKVIE